MKTNKNIKTLAELHHEIQRLKQDIKHREAQLLVDSKTYIKSFSPFSLLKKFATPNGLLKLDEKTHLSSKLMSVVLPMLLNSTVFRGSGLITKALGALVSRKVGKSLDAESLSGIANLIGSLFKGKKKKEGSRIIHEDYGIPPDSETY